MMQTTGNQRGGRRAKHVLAATLGAALVLPSLSAANIVLPSRSVPALGDSAPAWPGPWNRTDVQRLVVAEAVSNGEVPAALALAVVEVESEFVPRTIGAGGAVGLMQLLPATVNSELGADVSVLKDPATNVRLGLRWLARLHDFYDGDWELALSHFRGGELAPKNGRYQPHAYTRSYVRRVMGRWRYYERDLLVQAWIREANGAPRFVAGRTDPWFEARPTSAWDTRDWRHLPKSRPHHYCARFRIVHHWCDESAALNRPSYRFDDGGRRTAIERTPTVRYRYGGPWVPVTGDGCGSGRFQ